MFAAATVSYADDTFWRLCENPLNITILLSLGGIAHFNSHSVLTTALVVLTACGGLHLMNRRSFWNYVVHSLDDDLRDISKVYVESGGCILVATDFSGKVVGCAVLKARD